MKNKDFVVFILTHGRPDNVITVNTLKKCGYTGPIYFIVDNEDKTADQYMKNFGQGNVIIFDKKQYADAVDEGNNFDERRTITMARNACFDAAKLIGAKYFIELDDDYGAFEHRYIKGEKLMVIKIQNLNKIFDLYLEFYKNTNFLAISFAQGGDFIGGAGNPYAINMPLMRKCMNSFICSTERPFQFIGAMNEDVNTYTTLGSRGNLLGTLPFISLVQKQTQQQKGGITDMYLKYGTYCKAATTVMMHPSGTLISMMNSSNPRIHHLIKWNNTVPCIIDERHKKIYQQTTN